MGLFGGYIDPQQFQDSGGLLGRLLSLQRQQGLHQPDVDLDRTTPGPQVQIPWQTSQGSGLTAPLAPGAPQNLHAQYSALRSILGDRNAMLATVNPDIGRTLIAQALASQQQPGNTGNPVSAGYGGPVASDASPAPIRPGSWRRGAIERRSHSEQSE